MSRWHHCMRVAGATMPYVISDRRLHEPPGQRVPEVPRPDPQVHRLAQLAASTGA